MPYSFEVFLITLISTLDSFSARRAASMLDIHRLPMGSFMYRVIVCFFIQIIFSFRLGKFLFSSPGSRPGLGCLLHTVF